MSKLTSTTQPLKPTVRDTTSGKTVPEGEWVKEVTSLINWVTSETRKLYSPELIKELGGVKTTGSANSWGRQQGYVSDYKNLPTGVKAKSRLNELVLHKVISETFAYTQNPNPRKQAPTFAMKINLGAVDKQMVSLSADSNVLRLLWKTWTKEYLFTFQIPKYITTKRALKKWCLPTVQIENREPVFRFPYEEGIVFNPKTELTAGLDLGRAEPYTMVVLDGDVLVSSYVTSKRLKTLNTQRENILKHKSNIISKIAHYEALKSPHLTTKKETLIIEKNHLGRKALTLGTQSSLQQAAEIGRKLDKHKLNTLNIENLKWVTGSKYGSKWNHSQQVSAIEHNLARKGIRVKRVNPHNTSQTCNQCGNKITHNTKLRSIYCSECKISMDRDFNAAMNITKNKNTHLAKHSMNENNHSSTVMEQVIGVTHDGLSTRTLTSFVT